MKKVPGKINQFAQESARCHQHANMAISEAIYLQDERGYIGQQNTSALSGP